MKYLCSFFLLISTLISSVTSHSIDVKHTIEDGFEHPDAHFYGFVLSDVFVHHVKYNTNKATHTLSQRKLKFGQNSHLINSTDGFDLYQNLTQEIESLDASSNLNRNKVRALAKLAFYNEQRDLNEFILSEDLLSQYDSSELYFDANTTGEMRNVTQAVWEAARKEIDDISNSIGASTRLYDTPDNDSSRLEIGLSCLLFTRGSDTILLFPSTSSLGDFAYTVSLITPAATDTDSPLGATNMLKQNWLRAGLEWGQEQLDRESEPDWYIKTLFPLVATILFQLGFGQDLVNSVDGEQIGGDGDTISLSLEEATQEGYWPVAKAVIEQIRKDLPEGGRILFTGHSLGGGLAQMARMYTEKKYQETWPVVSFAAIGAACFPRKLYGIGSTDYLDDVDPTIYYENVTNYQVLLDPYGGGLGPDIGDTCYLGKYDIENNLEQSTQYKYCKEMYGYSFARTLFDENLGFEPLRTKSLLCRFMTHPMYEYMTELAKIEELNDDGTTYGGCSQYAGASLGSNQCPSVNENVLEAATKVALFIPAIFFVLSRLLF